MLQHHDWAYFERASKLINGVDRINLTGGEPTAHPLFSNFVPRFKDLFNCRRLTLSTNGYRVRELQWVIKNHIDQVDFSDYEDNREALAILQSMRIPLNVYPGGFEGGNFVDREWRGTGKGCFRACAQSGTVAYADGKLYGCCVAPGVSEAIGIEPAVNWRDVIPSLPLPCNDCWFSE